MIHELGNNYWSISYYFSLALQYIIMAMIFPHKIIILVIDLSLQCRRCSVLLSQISEDSSDIIDSV